MFDCCVGLKIKLELEFRLKDYELLVLKSLKVYWNLIEDFWGFFSK
jgi:hypothetical protein